ncbi:MAG: hypothetical protein WAM75_06630 [Xanthobacteraceae bacterium]
MEHDLFGKPASTLGSRQRAGLFSGSCWLGTLAVFAIAGIAPSLLNSTTTNVTELIKSLFFIPYVKDNGLTHPVLFLGWTLNYEIFFYGIFAFALSFGARLAPIIATAVITSLVLIGLLFPIHTEPFQFWTRPIMLEFLLGVWIFVGWQKGVKLSVSPGFALTLGALLLVFMGWEETRKSFDWNRTAVVRPSGRGSRRVRRQDKSAGRVAGHRRRELFALSVSSLSGVSGAEDHQPLHA